MNPELVATKPVWICEVITKWVTSKTERGRLNKVLVSRLMCEGRCFHELTGSVGEEAIRAYAKLLNIKGALPPSRQQCAKVAADGVKLPKTNDSKFIEPEPDPDFAAFMASFQEGAR